MSSKLTTFASLTLVLTAFQPVWAESWPQFRGPDGQGHSTATNLPLTWSETENVTWKTPLPGSGWSSPVVVGDQIWLTTALDEGRSFHALCVNKTSGKITRDVEVFARDAAIAIHPTNSYASPTAIVEGDQVYVHFGPYGTACLSTAGEIVWSKKLPHVQAYGPSSTPVLFEDLLIVQCHGTDVRYLAALDKKTGNERWKLEHDGRCSESTPLVIRTDKGDQLICNVSERVVSVDPRTGKILWTAAQGNNFAQVPRAVFGHGLVFTCGGYFEPVVQAIRPDGQGDVTDSHVAWKSSNKSIPLNPSPVLDGNELFLVNDAGIGSCFDALTGKLHWRERLGSGTYASPVSADGRIYFFDTSGTTTVIKAGPQFEVLATNKLDEKTMASPAIVDKAIYVRTASHLYRLEKPAGTAKATN